MISNFEKRLASLEKDNPCESDRDLLILIDKLIEEELSKGKAGDTELISEAVSFALTLKDSNDDGANSSAEEALEYVKRKSTRRTLVFRPRRIAALIAAVMLIAVLSVGVYAFIKKRFDMENITKVEFETVEKNQKHTEDGMDYYVSDKVFLYETVEEVLSHGHTESLLYPEGYDSDGVTVTELDEYTEFRFTFSKEDNKVQMIIETPVTRELYFPDKTVGAHKASVVELEGGCQTEFVYNGCIYTVISETCEEAEELILSMTERGAK